MSIFAFVGNKGGAGKTTLCVNVAAALTERKSGRKTGGNPSVLVIDSDPQQSSRHWLQLAEGDDALSVIDGSTDLEQAISEHSSLAGHLVIDCPPSALAEQTRIALRAADVAIVPVQPSPLDLWATLALEDEIQAARESNPTLKALVVVNQLEPRTKLSKLMRKATAELSLPTAETAIRRRMVFRTCGLDGGSVVNSGSLGRDAREEINQLIEEILAL